MGGGGEERSNGRLGAGVGTLGCPRGCHCGGVAGPTVIYMMIAKDSESKVDRSKTVAGYYQSGSSLSEVCEEVGGHRAGTRSRSDSRPITVKLRKSRGFDPSYSRLHSRSCSWHA